MLTATPWRRAWQDALLGPAGFYRWERPAEHFRTSAHVSGPFAEALVRLVRERCLRTVVDVGAGAGELLCAIAALTEPGELALTGVDVADRPPGLAADIGWCPVLPHRIDGLLVANEWLDTIACDVVEVDADGVCRQVLVDVDSGLETLGAPVSDPWLDRWWPLVGALPGTRAEIGAPRDDAWDAAVDRMGSGLAVAIDYGHCVDDRPPLGSLRAYHHGRQVRVRPDGSCDVTADVAVDAVADRTGGMLDTQRSALTALGADATAPPATLARTDPAAYLTGLVTAGRAAELVRPGGLGDYWWVVCER